MTQSDTELRNTKNVTLRARNWTFTWNNYTAEDIDTVTQLKYKRIVYQEEKGESGTPHLQGVIIFDNPRSFNSVKKMLPKCHLEIAKNIHAAINYCKKEDTRTGIMFDSEDNKMGEEDDLCIEDRIYKKALIDIFEMKGYIVDREMTLPELKEMFRKTKLTYALDEELEYSYYGQ